MEGAGIPLVIPWLVFSRTVAFPMPDIPDPVDRIDWGMGMLGEGELSPVEFPTW